jgi:tetraacyldisaccharide 4'-kinase
MIRSMTVNAELMVLGTAGWVGNGKVLPAGPLRVPVSAVRRADALVVLDEPGAAPGWRDRAAAVAGSIPVVVARMSPTAIVAPDGSRRSPESFRGTPVAAWSGIARHWRFRRLLVDMGVDIRSFVAFPDHHTYSRRDVDRLARETVRLDAIPLTTAKDAARWPTRALWTPYYLEMGLDVADDAASRLIELLEGALHG